MFRNLIAEMARKNLKQEIMASDLKISSSTLSDKMNGKRKWNREEMWIIRKKFFPHLGIEYLFEKEEDNEGKNNEKI